MSHVHEFVLPPSAAMHEDGDFRMRCECSARDIAARHRSARRLGHVHAYVLAPSPAAMEDADFRPRCACGSRQPEPEQAGCPKHRRYWSRQAEESGRWTIYCPCGTVIGYGAGIRQWVRP
jgi:hypothetical protein